VRLQVLRAAAELRRAERELHSSGSVAHDRPAGGNAGGNVSVLILNRQADVRMSGRVEVVRVRRCQSRVLRPVQTRPGATAPSPCNRPAGDADDARDGRHVTADPGHAGRLGAEVQPAPRRIGDEQAVGDDGQGPVTGDR